MTVHDTRPVGVVPAPHAADPIPLGDARWIEPWLFAPRSRPRTEYWDVETASWISSQVIPRPRQGD
jgi:hypothetical protein